MTQRRKNILTTMAALVAVFVGLWLFIHREPRYDGRSLSEWADIGLRATDQEPWNTADVLMASNAIRQIGAKAMPFADEWNTRPPALYGIHDKLLMDVAERFRGFLRSA